MVKLSIGDRKKNANLYNSFQTNYYPDGWSRETQDKLFKNLLRIIEFTLVPLRGNSCLDVGCGTGRFSQYLRSKGVGKYLGVDIYPPSLQRAQEIYPLEIFLLKDILEEEIGEKFDYCFCSGALSTKLETNNYLFLEEMIKKMWELSKVGVSFNLIGDQALSVRQEVFAYSPSRVREICKSIEPSMKIHSYPIPERDDWQFFIYR